MRKLLLTYFQKVGVGTENDTLQVARNTTGTSNKKYDLTNTNIQLITNACRYDLLSFCNMINCILLKSVIRHRT